MPTETIRVKPQVPVRTPDNSNHPTRLPKATVPHPPGHDKPGRNPGAFDSGGNILSMIFLTLPVSILILFINKTSLN